MREREGGEYVDREGERREGREGGRENEGERIGGREENVWIERVREERGGRMREGGREEGGKENEGGREGRGDFTCSKR